MPNIGILNGIFKSPESSCVPNTPLGSCSSTASC